jgi:hypothetical protein
VLRRKSPVSKVKGFVSQKIPFRMVLVVDDHAHPEKLAKSTYVSYCNSSSSTGEI